MPDVAEAALLLEVALVERARVREHPLLASDHEHDRVLETLGVVQGHQRDQPVVVAAIVGVGDQRDLLEEVRQRRLARGIRLRQRVVLGGDVDQLLEVLEPSLRLDRALGLERLEVSGLLRGPP